MPSPILSNQTAQDALVNILHQILVIATRALRDIHIRASTAQILKTILTANAAGARIGRAIRLTTLLIRRLQFHGLTPLAPTARPTPGIPQAPRPARTPQDQPGTPRVHTGNADDAFIRRPLHVVIAAITRELHLAARILGVPLPENLQHLCLHAALATGALPPATPALPAPPTPPEPDPHTIDPNPQRHRQAVTPAPSETLEL